jgi:hypothetical protein
MINNFYRISVTRHCLRSFSFIFILFFSLAPNIVFAAQQENTDNKTSAPSEKNNEGKDEEKQKETSDNEPSDDSSMAVKKAPRSEIDIIAPIDTLTNKKADLKHYLPAEMIQPLLVGPEDHTTLISTNNAINNKGIMILLPDWQQTAASPKALNALRKTLPDQGWTTISVLPPNKPENYPSLAIEQTAREEENKKTLNDYQQQLAKIMEAVTEKAKGYPGIIVVVAEGHNAALLFNIYREELAEKPTALIIMGAHLNDDMANLTSATNLSLLELPVLDLYLKADNYLISSNIKLRKKLVNQELKSNFRQRKIYNIRTSYYPPASLIKEINGWLKSIGW